MIHNQIWFIAKADFKERTRRFSFLVLCVLAALAAFLFVPNPDAEMTSIAVDAKYFSQTTNWTWIPMASALCTGVLLPVTGFFYLRNSLSLDRKTGIVDLVYTSPVGRVTYLFGKYLSNLLILLYMLLVVTLTSLCMTILQFPSMKFSVVHCFSYFLCMIPGIFLCAALTLMTEAVPLFRSRIGVWMAGIVYFVIYVVYISSLFDDSQGIIVRLFDMTGFLWLKDSINQSVYSITGKPAQVAMFVFEDGMINNQKLPELFFAPLSFTSDRLFEKISMIIFGIVLCFASSVLMPRYENARKISSISEKTHRKTYGHGVFITEFILTFRSCSLVWLVVMFVLWLSMFFADIETAQGILWILSIAWSCVLFSEYGCREKINNLNTLLPTLFQAYSHQLLIRFCVGGAVSLLVSVPIILRTTFISGFSGAAAGIIFALFIPALSIFLGQISGSERMFEIIFLIICYLMLNTASFITLCETSGKAIIYYAIVSIITFFMLLVSCWIRKIQ
ncbi:MAG: hypothetical protein HDR07_02360 [Lachnospiraceae bacterium]|nr:hypothetical protein [Lachnospiraceae bacterium]